MGELHIFAGNANRELAAEVAAKLDMQTGRASVKKFSDGEVVLWTVSLFCCFGAFGW